MLSGYPKSFFQQGQRNIFAIENWITSHAYIEIRAPYYVRKIVVRDTVEIL